MTVSQADTLLNQLALAQQQAAGGNLAAAQSVYDAVSPQAGNDLQLNLQLALLALQLHDSAATQAHLQAVLAADPEDPDTLATVARCLGEMNQHSKGIEIARKAVAMTPSQQEAQAILGSLLTEAGETEAAQQQFETMIAAGINLRLAYTNLARLKKFSGDDESLIAKAESILSSGITSHEQLAIHFALGKIYDDCADYEKAFGHFRQANLLQKEPYDHANDLRWFDQAKTVFSATNIARLCESGNQSRQPVFIVGMPRSGTTLMERIVASHSQGAGAGELVAMAQIAHQVMRENENKAEERALRRMTPEHLSEYGQRYLQILRLGQVQASRIVDKLPGNYQNLGLIHTLFPDATIIHAIRHPLDTCLSCYFQAFAEVRWSNSLKAIADTYKLYRRYMEYWHEVLPKGKILEVNYEALVENPVEQGQRMLAHCGLEWEAESLEYYQQQAAVRTVSHAQVRQPIYQSSKKRWVNYAGHLQTLVDELGDYLGEEQDSLAAQGLEVKKKKKRFGLF